MPSASLTSSRKERSETSAWTPYSPPGREEDRPDLLDDGLVERDHVAVAPREDRVEVHGGALARHLGPDHEPRRTLREHVGGEHAHRPRGRALAHADQDDAVADRHHVAALHARHAPVVVGAAEPDLEVGVAEARMEAVDRLDVQRLELARRPEHRIERHTAVQPGARVAREQLVRQRCEDEVGRAQGRADRLPHLLGQLEHGQAPGQPGRQLVRGHLVQPLPERSGEHHRHVLRADAAREEPVTRSRILERLREQLMEEDDLDPAFTHEVGERVELLPRAANPDHVVEEQLVAVRRRQPLVREVGPVHHHRAELPDLRMCPERGVRRGAHLSISSVFLRGGSRSGPTRSARPAGASVARCGRPCRRIRLSHG